MNTETTTIRIATRGSKLALLQAKRVAELIGQKAPGIQTELVVLKTKGDITPGPIAEAVQSGDERKGFFTKEIEDALLQETADVAVHSLKDLPSEDTPGLTIAAIPERIASSDILVFLKEKQVRPDYPYIGEESVIGTSSVRRKSQIEHTFGQLTVTDIRGNVPTRLAKLFESDGPDAVILSAAGIERLKESGELLDEEKLSRLTFQELPLSFSVPAPGQGALAVQCRTNDSQTRAIVEAIHSTDAFVQIQAERNILRGLEGGCNLPLGAHCVTTPDFTTLHVFLGKESEENRWKHSRFLVRTGKDPQSLSQRVLSEIKSRPPVTVFASREKIEQIKAEMHLVNVRLIEALETVPVYDEQTVAALESSLQGNRPVIAVMSSKGAFYLKKLTDSLNADSVKERFNQALWAVPGASTAKEIEKLFSFENPPDFLISPDGTSAGLAEEIASIQLQMTSCTGISPVNGRSDFYDLLAEEGISAQRLNIYESKAVGIHPVVLQQLKDQWLLFGSPLAFESFLESAGKNGVEITPDFQFYAIGSTTASAIEKAGFPVYGVADEPDYLRILTER